MLHRAYLLRRSRCLGILTALLISSQTTGLFAAPVTVSLDAESDPTSYFLSIVSAGIARMNLVGPVPDHQSFWDYPAESFTYNDTFDFFPNDEAMRFGSLEYDDTGLVGGSGTVPITSLSLGIQTDPSDPGYINGAWLTFTTTLGPYSGNVTLDEGVLTDIDLTADYTLSGSYGPFPSDGAGTFTISGGNFSVLASATIDTSGVSPIVDGLDPALVWNWTGSIDALDSPVPEPSSAVLALFLGSFVIGLAWRRRRSQGAPDHA